MEKFSATIEILSGQGAAIVTLFDSRGEWSGSRRMEVRSGRADDLYEAGYIHASVTARCKGGMLDRYARVSA